MDACGQSPDVPSLGFGAGAHGQSLAIANSPDAREDQDFIDAVSDWSNG